MSLSSDDPRLTAALALAVERGHPFYAAVAYRLARKAGDTVAMQQALDLGAARWRPEPAVYAHTEDEAPALAIVSTPVQLDLLLEEAA